LFYQEARGRVKNTSPTPTLPRSGGGSKKISSPSHFGRGLGGRVKKHFPHPNPPPKWGRE